MGEFDHKGDLWIAVIGLETIPGHVEKAKFSRSVQMPSGVWTAGTEINLSAYIRDLIREGVK